MESEATDLAKKLRVWKAHKEELEGFKARKLATKPKWGAPKVEQIAEKAPFTPSANRLNRLPSSSSSASSFSSSSSSSSDLATPQKHVSAKTPSITPSRISSAHPQNFYQSQLEAAHSFFLVGEYAKAEAVYQLLWASPFSEQAAHDSSFWDGWFQASTGGLESFSFPQTSSSSTQTPTPKLRSSASHTPSLRTPFAPSQDSLQSNPTSSRTKSNVSLISSSSKPRKPRQSASSDALSEFKASFFSPRKNLVSVKYRPPAGALGTPRTLAAKRGEFLSSQSSTPNVRQKKSFGSQTPIADRLRRELQQIDEDEDKRKEAALDAMKRNPELVPEEVVVSQVRKETSPTTTTPGTPKAMKSLVFGDEKKDEPSLDVTISPHKTIVSLFCASTPTYKVVDGSCDLNSANRANSIPLLSGSTPTLKALELDFDCDKKTQNSQAAEPAPTTPNSASKLKTHIFANLTITPKRLQNSDTASTSPTGERNGNNRRSPFSLPIARNGNETPIVATVPVSVDLMQTAAVARSFPGTPTSTLFSHVPLPSDNQLQIKEETSLPPLMARVKEEVSLDEKHMAAQELSDALEGLSRLESMSPIPTLSPIPKTQKKLTKRKSFPMTPAPPTSTPKADFVVPSSVQTRQDVPIIHTLFLPSFNADFSEEDLSKGTIALEAVRVKSLRKSTQNEISNYDSTADMILSPVRRSARRKSIQTSDEISDLLKKTNYMYSANPDLKTTAKRLRPAAPRFPLETVKEETKSLENEPSCAASASVTGNSPKMEELLARRSARVSSRMSAPFETPCRRIDTPRPASKSLPRTHRKS